MERVVERLQGQLAALRSGRARAGMLDSIQARLPRIQLQEGVIGTRMFVT
jgi:ribosome recycling factor